MAADHPRAHTSCRCGRGSGDLHQWSSHRFLDWRTGCDARGPGYPHPSRSLRILRKLSPVIPMSTITQSSRATRSRFSRLLGAGLLTLGGWLPSILPATSISEPDTLLYGRILNRSGSAVQVITAGTLTWTFQVPGSEPRTFSTDSRALAGWSLFVSASPPAFPGRHRASKFLIRSAAWRRRNHLLVR